MLENDNYAYLGRLPNLLTNRLPLVVLVLLDCIEESLALEQTGLVSVCHRCAFHHEMVD